MNVLNFIKLFTFNAVEGEVASETPTPEVVVQIDHEPLADTAWQALEQEEEAEKTEDIVHEVQPDFQQPVSEEQAPEQPVVEPAPTIEQNDPAKPVTTLTEEDLKPLGSRNPATNERFQKMTDGYKEQVKFNEELKAEKETLTQRNNEFKESIDSLRQLGFNDEAAATDLIEFSGYRDALYKGDAEKFKSVIEAQVKQFELIHGKSIQLNTDILEGHPELRQRVENLELDVDIAREVARTRDLNARATRDRTQQTTIQQTEQQQNQEIDTAAASVQALEASWKANDPDYNAILEDLRPLMADLRQLPPSTWANTIQTQYNAIKRARVAGVKPTNPTPLRNTGNTQGKAVPQNTQEAVLQAMGMDLPG